MELGGMKLKNIINENSSIPFPAQDPITNMLLGSRSSPHVDSRWCLSKSKCKAYWF